MTAAAIAGIAITMLRNMPPHRMIMATGPEGDAYHEIAERYRAALARENVELQLLPTAGSVENLANLLNPHSGVSVGLIEGGIARSGNPSELESLGTVLYEPLWWFHKREITAQGVDALRGQKVSIGPEGSGTRALLLELMKRTRVEGQFSEVLALAPLLIRARYICCAIISTSCAKA